MSMGEVTQVLSREELETPPVGDLAPSFELDLGTAPAGEPFSLDLTPSLALAVEQALLKRVPKEYLQHAHHWLILLGRYVCQARKPRCWECSVAAHCDFKPKTPLKTPLKTPAS